MDITIHDSNAESKKHNIYVLIHSLKKLVENNTEGRYTIQKELQKV